MAKAPSEPTASAVTNNSGRIKYADPRDLPSFPSKGLSSDGAAASAAASLGWANQKSPEPWRPEKASSASAAAVLAKDYKASPTWEPSANSAGANKAALLAVGSAGAALKQAPSTSEKKGSHDSWGNSAATQAFNANRSSVIEKQNLASGESAATQAFNKAPARKGDAPVASSGSGDRSLAAAKGAMSSSKHSSTPDTAAAAMEIKRLERSAAANALNGATLAHRNSLIVKAPLEDVGAVPVTTMTRNMFTSNPPVKPEVDEKANNERLHQTAVEMAKKMYLQQQKMLDQTKDAQEEKSETPYAGTYLNLQDAAYKQAQERLAKLHDEHLQGREFQEYYGNSSSTPKRTFSLANKLRRRSSGEADPDDRERSKKIREQMSMFSSKLSQVDKEKRSQDREALLAAAQRNVKARLQGMDEKVYKDTGKRNSTMLTDFELKAQQAAQSRSDNRNENKGKIDIGGGKFMTQDEINAIAAKRLQPVLDDINEKAETERERVATLKMEEEARREEAEKQKARDRQEKELNKKLKAAEKQDEKAKKQQAKDEEKARKNEEKAKKQQSKNEEKARRDQEKAAKAEELRLAKEEKRQSKLDTAAAKKDASSDLAPALATTAPGEETEEAAGTAERVEDDDVDSDKSALESDDDDNVEETKTEEIKEETKAEEIKAEAAEVKETKAREPHAEETKAEAAKAKETPEHDEAEDSDLLSGEEDDDEEEVAVAPALDTTAEQSEGSKHTSVASSSPKKGKVRGWLKNRLSRSKSTIDKEENVEKRKSFFGGSLRKKSVAESSGSADNRSSSIRDIALAGKSDATKEDEEETTAVATKATEKNDGDELSDSHGVSPVSTPGAEEFKDALQTSTLEAPAASEEPVGRLSSSGSRFREEIQ